jgi:O-antigen ligase
MFIIGSVEFDFFGRLRSFSETFGPGVIVAIIALAVIAVMISLWRGTGLIIFILFLTYSVGALTRGGVIFASTLTRWACLALLGIGFFKGFSPPKASMLFFGFYAILAFILVIFSSFPAVAIQQGILLLTTVICVPIAINSYIKSAENIRRLFKMGIVAGAVWTLVNTMFLSEFMYSTETRFIAEGTAGTGVIAYAGAFFAPMIAWGIIQKRDVIWKIFSMILIVPFTTILLLSGVRSAILGMLGIGLFPLLFLRGKPIRALVQLFVVFLLMILGVGIVFVLVPTKGEALMERLTHTSTTGRYYIWADVLNYCFQHPFSGHGIGAGSTEGVLMIGHLFHNSYLEIWYNTSLFGLFAVLVFLGIYLLRSFRLVMAAPTEELAVFSRVALGYILGICVMNMFEGSLAGAGGISVTMLLIIAVMIDKLGQMIQEESYYKHVDEEKLSVESCEESSFEKAELPY